MRFLRRVAFALPVVASFLGASVAFPSTVTQTLTFDANAGHPAVTLRSEKGRLAIVDDKSGALLASAPAATTRRVVIRGTPGAHNDTLTVDLITPMVLAEGIDYDGGAAGWDTLIIQGGFASRETATAFSPSDGVFDLDGLQIRYTNLEPITDSVPAATFTITGTAGADVITVSNGPAGTTTVSAPTFESVTFSNKTTVTIDGGGGVDTIALNNTIPAAGLVTLIVTNMDTVTQSAAEVVTNLSISAANGIVLTNAGNAVSGLEASTANGNITITNSVPVTIGNVDPLLDGLLISGSGDILLTNTGTITLIDSDGAQTVQGGTVAGSNVSLIAVGATADITSAVDRDSVTATRGDILLNAGRDILLGTGGLDFDNDVRASGTLTLQAARDITLDGFADASSDDFAQATGGNAIATAGRDITLNNNTGVDASFGASGSAGADAVVTTGTGGTLSLLVSSASAVFSSSGDVAVNADHLIIGAAAGIAANLGTVVIQMATPGGNVDLGPITDLGVGNVEVSDAELDRITTPIAIFGGSSTFNVMVSAPMTFTTGTTLSLVVNGGTFVPSGTGSLSANTLLFTDLSSTSRVWTISGASSTIDMSSGGAIPFTATNLGVNGGSGSDTFLVSPHATTTFTIDGNLPTPPALPGDDLNVNTSGTTNPTLNATSAPDGFMGTYTFGNRAAVNFREIETLAPSSADLSITKTNGVTSVSPGSPVSYTITVSDTSALGVAGATVTDTFSSLLLGVTWTCSPSPGSACTAVGSGNINQTVTVAPGGGVAFIVTGTLSPSAASGTLTNTASVAVPSGVTDTNLLNNSATDADAIVSADVALTKTADVTFVTPSSTVTYTITATNLGTLAADNVVVTDPLPAGSTFSSAIASQGSCLLAATTVTCSLGTIGPSALATVTLVVTSPSVAGDMTNTASVATTSVDVNLTNNIASITLGPTAGSIPTASPLTLMLLALVLAFVGLALIKSS